MTFPAQNFTILDPGPGTTAAPGTVFHVISGVATGGSTPVNTPTFISDITKVRSQVGYGPLAEDVAYAIQEFGGVVFVIHNATGTPLSSAVLTHAGSGGSPPAVTVSGTPNDEYNIVVTVAVGGARGTATFFYSLDGWNVAVVPATQSQTRVTAATFVMPGTGLTLNFPTGTYVAADTYTLAVTPNIVQTSDLSAVATALENQPSLVFDLWMVSGTQAVATTAGALAASFSGYLTTLTSTQRFARGFIDIGSGDTEANVKTEAAAWSSTRIDPCYGYSLVESLLPFEGFTTRQVSSVTLQGVRGMRELISTDLSRTASGPVNDCVAIAFDSNYDTTVDALQISTMRTWSGKPGFYIAGSKLKCPFGSNFTDLQYGRVMDTACLTTYNAQFPFQSSSFRVTTGGHVDPRDANSMVTVVQQALNNALINPSNAEGKPGHVSSVTYSVNLTADLQDTQQLQTTVALVPLGYAKIISTTLFFTVQTAAA